MDRIKLFYSNLNIKPKILINHFSRYLGFYVEDIVGNTQESDIESLIDIYIVSEEYVKQTPRLLSVKNNEKTIVIYMDEWRPKELEGIRCIRYNGQGDEAFLKQLWQCMFEILFARVDVSRRLVGSISNAKKKVAEFIKAYVRYNILQMSVFTRCSPAHRDMFKSSYFRYRFFIGEILKLMKQTESNLLRYMRLLAFYEIDMICKVNSYKPYRTPMLLQKECEALLREYGDNEELHIIQADISLHLNGVWNKAGNEFSDIRLTECAYAYLRKGNILRNYARDREAALYAYEHAVEKKEDYFIAWFQMGECAREQMAYRMAVRSYAKVVEVLKGRYNAQILSPLEITYLYKAHLESARIYKVELKDAEEAEEHIRLSQSIQVENISNNFFRLLWDDDGAYKKFSSLIKEKLETELEDYIAQMEAEETAYYEYRRSHN